MVVASVMKSDSQRHPDVDDPNDQHRLLGADSSTVDPNAEREKHSEDRRDP